MYITAKHNTKHKITIFKFLSRPSSSEYSVILFIINPKDKGTIGKRIPC